MKKLLIADDHKMVREALAGSFRREGLDVVAQAKSAPEAVELAQETRPDLVVLDVAMPGSVVDAIRELKEQEPPPKVLILTASDDEGVSIRCVKAGADGFIRKTEPTDVLLEAVNRLLAGGKYVNAELAFRLVMAEDDGTPGHECLSKRELQVLKRLGDAQTVTGIAEEMGLSFKTISTYRTRILEKMGFENNTDIIRYCLDHGLGANGS